MCLGTNRALNPSDVGKRQWEAKALGVSPRSWPQQARPACHQRTTRIVSKAQCGGGHSFAIMAAPTDRLQRPCGSQWRQCCTPASLATRLLAVQEVYDYTFDLPADLASACQQRRQASSLFDEEPALELLSVQGKYGPWKTALLMAWCQTSRRRTSRQKTSRCGVSSRAALLLRALSQACRLMANVDYKDWVNHWGRGVTHHSGFIPMLLRLQVIRKSAARDRGSLCLGLGSSSYRLASRAQSTRLGAWVVASDVIAQVLEANSTPRTLEEYWHLWKALEARRQELPALPAQIPHPLPHVIIINACVPLVDGRRLPQWPAGQSTTCGVGRCGRWSFRGCGWGSRTSGTNTRAQ